MEIIDLFNENRLATLSLVLGILETAIFFILAGSNVFIYLGIPAIAIGVISLMHYREQHHHIHLAMIAIPIVGIILGILPILFTFLGIF